ncbi:QacE family quaternary ammonium compound efflux SMR transporter [Pseudoclavibacter endophyticus]|uniref:Multidrug efflux SMR transporter n=1 Tax=Pseudoclavibacter endophyticus TaxID=1778590 RepID=A0A6H9WS87_9MICO|nr:multidrug efflux SMR transporter [Pseudoclavibacter endophyticus]GGA61502.1 QacE family quaternary ammonium compound efflux SMR transporter [Pseudoclavibacter endophyticus]
MAWVILVLSGVFEAVWATALGKSDGFTKLWPTVVFAVALIVSMAGLAVAMRDLPTGTAYAVWVAVGASLTAGYAMATGDEPVSIARILLILGIVACVVGLKLVTPDVPVPDAPIPDAPEGDPQPGRG